MSKNHMRSLLASCVVFAVITTNAISGGNVPLPDAQLRTNQTSNDQGKTVLPLTTLLLKQKVKKTKAYTEDTTEFLNPERGFHGNADILNETDLSWIRTQGNSLARAYIRLDDYRNQSLPPHFLTRIGNSLALARSAGIKIILRFSYNFGIGEDDAPLNRVEEHIQQLSPLFDEYQDVIAVLQAGFIGAWGEWHNSSNGLDTQENKTRVLTALLSALPVSRTVQLRYPGDIIDNFPDPLNITKAYSGSDIARVGHHNDCFLSSDDDVGTYWPHDRQEEFKTYLQQSTSFSPTGGETCQVSPEKHRTDCETTLSEMARFHWSYLNQDFYAPDINRWKSEGCYDEISRRLGYRYRLLGVTYDAQAQPGSNLEFEFEIINDGFSSLYNPRPLHVILSNQGGKRTFLVAEDVRPLLPSSGESKKITATVSLPHSMERGEYDVSLHLPDWAATLSPLPEFSIRLANRNMWRQSTGYNQLGITVLIE